MDRFESWFGVVLMVLIFGVLAQHFRVVGLAVTAIVIWVTGRGLTAALVWATRDIWQELKRDSRRLRSMGARL
jgi:hypothetical protein